MNNTAKSAMLLTAMLMMGIVLGVTGAGAFQRQFHDGPPGPRGPRGGLERHMEETIQPRDSAQAEAIRPILARTAERNRQIIGGVNTTLKASIDSMKLELAPLLDEEQRARLDVVTRALPPLRGPGGPGPFGPPPGGRRPPPFGPPPDPRP